MKKLRRILGTVLIGMALTIAPVQACTPEFGSEIANERAEYLMWAFDDILLEQLIDYNVAGMITSSKVKKDHIEYFFEYIETPSSEGIETILTTLNKPEGISNVLARISSEGKVIGIVITTSK